MTLQRFQDLEVDLHDDLLTYDQAALVFRFPARQLRVWKTRGHLAPSGTDAFGRPLFRGVDVLRAQARTERRRRVA